MPADGRRSWRVQRAVGPGAGGAVFYTHVALPTSDIVWISGVAGSLKKKKPNHSLGRFSVHHSSLHMARWRGT